MKQRAIQAHIDNGFFATFSQKKIGGVLEIPENIFLKKDAKQYLYEIDDDKLNIYIYGIKNKTHTLPQYCIRPFVMMDMICAMTNMGVSPLLLKVLDDNKNEVVVTDEPLTTRRAAELLNKPIARKQQSLESDMFKALEHFITNECVDLVTEDIMEGFEIISKNYLDKIEQ